MENGKIRRGRTVCLSPGSLDRGLRPEWGQNSKLPNTFPSPHTVHPALTLGLSQAGQLGAQFQSATERWNVSLEVTHTPSTGHFTPGGELLLDCFFTSSFRVYSISSSSQGLDHHLSCCGDADLPTLQINMFYSLFSLITDNLWEI